MVELPSLELVGLHSHIGSQIFDPAGFEVSAHRLVGLAGAVRDELGRHPLVATVEPESRDGATLVRLAG